MRNGGSAVPFRDIIGHRKLVALLSRSIARQTLPPSLILSGPTGVGKRLAAVTVAQTLNCLNQRLAADPDDAIPIDACGSCPACTRIARAVHPDVLTLEPNDKGNIRIDVVREAIDRAGYRPFEGRRRVAIVDPADALEFSAQNALLKMLEEPPSTSSFMLITSLPDLLLPTVRSRCPQLRFAPLSAAEVSAALVKRGHDEHDAQAVAALADGSIGRALEASASDMKDARQVALRVLSHAAASDDVRRRMDGAKELVATGSGSAATDRDKLAVHLRALSSLLRDVAALAASADRSAMANPDLAGALERLDAFRGDRGRQAFLAVDKALVALDRYTNAKLVADWVVLQL
jgi:DNA polymerase-3 subunit delta'